MGGRDVGRRLLVGLASLSLLAGCGAGATPPPGTPPPRVMVPIGPVPTCPPGSTPDEPGRVDQTRPHGPPTMAFDRRTGKMVAFAQTDNGVETWTFDVCTNTWTRMHPDQEPPQPPSWEPGLVYDVDSDVTIGIFERHVWAYELGADAWTRKSEVPSAGDFGPELLYHPVSGLVVAVDRVGGLWSYDVEADTWTPIRQETRPVMDWGSSAFAYDASVDRLVAYANAWGPPDEDGNRLSAAKTWLFDLRNGTWSGTGAATPSFTFPAVMATLNPAIVYDEAAMRIVISGSDGMATYDAAADRWETLFDLPGRDPRTTIPGRPEGFPRWLAYDPLNRRLVAPGEILATTDGAPLWNAPDGAAVGAYDLLAFDPLTREWTVLLEPSAGQPAP